MVDLFKAGPALESMRNSDFDAYSALGEVIDNSIQATADEIRIHFEYTPATPQQKREAIKFVAFGDNGNGMSPEELHHCLQLGYSSRYNDRSGIGRFGVGAILAAINQCQKVEVYSKEESGDWHYTYIDLGQITSDPPQMAGIPEPIVKAPSASLMKLTNENKGTLVVWAKYDRQPTDASEMIDEFHYWAGRTYRRFIWNSTKIIINGTELKAIDPLYVNTEKTKFPGDPCAKAFDPIEIRWPIPPVDRWPDGPDQSIICIRMSLLPEELRPVQGAGGSAAAKARYIDRNEGISIMRNDREVFFGHIPYWPGSAFKEIDRWWGGEISFDAILDKEFTVKNIKRGAVPVKELKSVLKSKMEPTRKTAVHEVGELWSVAKTEKKITDHENTVSTGHFEAEETAKHTPVPINLIDQGKDKAEESEKFTEEWIAHASDQVKAAWVAKFEGQPFTILDDQWKGPEFFESTHLGGSSVLKYNTRHPFFTEIASIRLSLEEEDADNYNANKLKALIDLLLISFAKAEAMFDKPLTMTSELFIEQMRMNWGNYLKNYISTYKRDFDDS